ncbi:Tissue factor pathway inhibitor [Halotydeus destructor]|nr:Tissue factor pathway inhibitor [Halotydeus destructor]
MTIGVTGNKRRTMKLLVLATCLITVCWCQSEPNPNCFLPLDPGTPPPPKKGLWQKQQIKFYYDVMKRDCRAFGYHGSGGNNNSFNSYPECNTACGENAMWIKPGSWFWETKDKCDHSPDVGTCYGYMPRYFFNGTANMCQPFSYGGCGGNENNFPTIGDCVKRCGGIVYRKPQPLPKPGGS